MEITWTDHRGNAISSRIDAYIMPVVETLGIDLAEEFLLKFGGRYIWITPKRIQDRNVMTDVIDTEQATRLISAFRAAGYAEHYRIPQAKVFLSRYMRSKGSTCEEIATRLKVSSETVRVYLKSDAARQSASEKRNAKIRDTILSEAVEDGIVAWVKPPLTDQQKTKLIKART